VAVRRGLPSTGSYGAGLARALREDGLCVLEVNRPDRSARRRNGKDDMLDAEAAARAVLAGHVAAQPKSGSSSVEMIRHLRIARDAAVKARTQAMLTIKSIIIGAPADLRERLEDIGVNRRGKRTLTHSRCRSSIRLRRLRRDGRVAGRAARGRTSGV
jgi:transposase